MLNTFSWNGGMVVEAAEGPWRFRADQRLSARLIRAGRSLRQEEYRGRVVVDHSFGQDWGAIAQQRSSSVTGPAGIDLGDVSQHLVLGGVRVGSAFGPRLTGLLGWEWNRQLGRDDAGLSGSVTGEVPGVTWEQLQMQGRGAWSASELGDRRPSDAAVEVSLRRPFEEGSAYALTASYEAQRRDLPAVGSGLSGGGAVDAGALLRRQEEQASVRQSLTWFIDPTLRGAIDAGWTSRQIERRYSVVGGPLPAGIRRSELAAGARLMWSPSAKWWNDLSMGFTRGEEQH
jgi:hypothetical protein